MKIARQAIKDGREKTMSRKRMKYVVDSYFAVMEFREHNSNLIFDRRMTAIQQLERTNSNCYFFRR